MSTAKTRYFLFSSAAILTAGLAAGTVAYVGGMPRAFASNAGPDELSLVPAGAAVVAYANVQGVMSSEFRQRLTTLMDDEGKGRQEFQEHTGIDVERDIDAVIAAMSPGIDGTGHQNGFVALRGRFDIAKIEALVTSKGGQLGEYKGARLLQPPARTEDEVDATVTPEEPTTPTVEPKVREHVSPVIALVNANLVIVGSDAAVKAAIDRSQGDGTASITSDGEFVRMLESVDQNSTVWAIGRPKVLQSGADIPTQVLQQLPEVKWFAASGHLNGGLQATVRAEGKDEEAGKNMREVLQGVLALARLQLDAKPELQPLLSSVQIEGTGNGVALHMTLPAEMLDVIVKQARATHDGHMRHLRELHQRAED
jgi:hypothetical protein